MALTQSQISALYVTLFGRVSEGKGNKFWLEASTKNTNLKLEDIADEMLKSSAAKEFFAGSLDSNESFIAHIYKTTLNKDANSDASGKAFWTSKLNEGMGRGLIVNELLKAALNPEYSKSKDPATKAAHDILVNKIILSNVIADIVADIPSGDIKNALKDFVELNSAITATSGKEDIKKIIESKKDVLGIDVSKIDALLEANSKVKIISNLTGMSESDVQKQLESGNSDGNSGSSDGGSNSGGSDQGGSNSGNSDNSNQGGSNSQGSGNSGGSSGGGNQGGSGNSGGTPTPPPVKEEEGGLKAMNSGGVNPTQIGFSAKIEIDGKKYFVSILSSDNTGVNPPLQINEKIKVTEEGEVVRASDGKKLVADAYIVKDFPDGDALAGVGKTSYILKAFTKDGHVFVPKDVVNGISYSQSFANAVYKEDGFFERPFGLVEGTTDGVYAQRVEQNGFANIYKLTKDNQVTYYVSHLEYSLSTGTIVIDGVKPGDKIKFHDGETTLERIASEGELGVNVKQIIKDGDDTIIYVNGSSAGFSNSDDIKIILKNVNLENLNAADGKFVFTQNTVASGVELVSKDGFVKLFEDSAPAVKIEDVVSIYKKEGKYYADAQASKELGIANKDDDSGSVKVKAIKFDSGEIFTFKSAKASQTKETISAYTLDDIVSKGVAGDTLTISDTTYKFGGFGAGKITTIQSDDFIFETSASSAMTLADAKNITKESFLAGTLADSAIKDATITTQGVEYKLGANADIKSFTTNLDKIKAILASPLKDKILNKAISLSDDSILTREHLGFVKVNFAKFADSAIKSLKLNSYEVVGIEADMIAKISNGAIELTDTSVLTKDQLKALIPNSEKLKDKTINSVENLTVDDFYEIFGSRSYSSEKKLKDSKISEKTITLVDTPEKIKEILGNSVLSESKVKKIALSSGNELSISASDFKKFSEKFSDAISMHLENVSSTDKNLIFKDQVKSFEIGGVLFSKVLDISASEYDTISTKLQGEGKFRIIDSVEKIFEFLNRPDLSKISGVKFVSKEVEIDSRQVKKLADISNLKIEADYGVSFKLIDSVANLSANDNEVLSKFADLQISASGIKKSIDIDGAHILELDKITFDSLSRVKFASDDNLKITEVTGRAQASNAKDIFVLKNDVSDLDISNFSRSDKIDFRVVNESLKILGDLNVASDAAISIQNGNIYKVAYSGSSYQFNFKTSLFGDGKAFADINEGAKAIVILKLGSYSVENKIYKLDDEDNDGNLTAGEITLLGSIRADLDSSNIVIE